jgi:hypothetical protein
VFSPATLVASTKYLLSQLDCFSPYEGEKNMSPLHQSARKQNSLLATEKDRFI